MAPAVAASDRLNVGFPTDKRPPAATEGRSPRSARSGSSIVHEPAAVPETLRRAEESVKAFWADRSWPWTPLRDVAIPPEVHVDRCCDVVVAKDQLFHPDLKGNLKALEDLQVANLFLLDLSHSGLLLNCRAHKAVKSHSRSYLDQPTVIVPHAHWEAYGRGSLPLHHLVSDSANPHYMSDPLPQPMWDHRSTGQL